MFINIPARNDIPETELFIKIIKKDKTQSLLWSRDVIVLIHGGPGGNHTLYSDVEKDLSTIADLVLIDLRGCGLSSKIEPKYCTLDIHIDDLYIVLQLLQIPSPIIHGCSYGAIMTLGFSIKYPQTPKKIILSSCAVSGDFIELAKENLKKRGSVEQNKVANRLWNGHFENGDQLLAYYQSMAPLYFFKKQSSDALPARMKSIPYNFELVNLAFSTFLKTFDYRADLSKIKADTLILAGKNDWIIDLEQAEIAHHGIHHSVLIVLEECGHFPWKDQREKFLFAMKNFVTTHLKEE